MLLRTKTQIFAGSTVYAQNSIREHFECAPFSAGSPQDPGYVSRLNSPQTGNADHTDATDRNKLTVNISSKASKQKIVANRDMFSALCGLRRQVPDLKAQNRSSKELKEGLVKKSL